MGVTKRYLRVYTCHNLHGIAHMNRKYKMIWFMGSKNRTGNQEWKNRFKLLETDILVPQKGNAFNLRLREKTRIKSKLVARHLKSNALWLFKNYSWDLPWEPHWITAPLCLLYPYTDVHSGAWASAWVVYVHFGNIPIKKAFRILSGKLHLFDNSA